MNRLLLLFALWLGSLQYARAGYEARIALKQSPSPDEPKQHSSVFSEPSTASKVLEELKNGQSVHLFKFENNWWLAKTQSGAVGYIEPQCLSEIYNSNIDYAVRDAVLSANRKSHVEIQ